MYHGFKDVCILSWNYKCFFINDKFRWENIDKQKQENKKGEQTVKKILM
jgi:hypothetical protein